MIYLENICKAPITVGTVRIAPLDVAEIDVSEDHPGVALAVKNKMLKKTTKKEFDAFTATKEGKEIAPALSKDEK